jgi:hypothetical protein
MMSPAFGGSKEQRTKKDWFFGDECLGFTPGFALPPRSRLANNAIRSFFRGLAAERNPRGDTDTTGRFNTIFSTAHPQGVPVMPRPVWILCLALALAGFAVPAQAGLIISIANASVTQGGTGTVDVLLMSTASPGTPDLINNYGFQLQITNNGSDNTQLAFSTNQNFGYISNTSLNPAYLFLGDSSDAQPPPSPVGSPGQTVYPNDTFTGADSTFSGNPVSLSAGTTYLLASLSVTTLTGASPIVGDAFTISLVPTSGTGSVSANTNTFFDNFNFNTGQETSAVPFTSSSGTVDILGASVPEPATLISGISALLILVGIHAARRLRQ